MPAPYSSQQASRLKFSVIRPNSSTVKAVQEATKVLVAEIERIGLKLANEMKDEFEKTTKGWEHQPEFEAGVAGQTSHVNKWRQTYIVYAGPKMTFDFRPGSKATPEQIWSFIDQGVKAHPIFPRNRRALSFQPTNLTMDIKEHGKSKTVTTRYIGRTRIAKTHAKFYKYKSLPTKRSWGHTNRAYLSVDWPGIEPRYFSYRIGKKFKSRLALNTSKDFATAMRRFSRATSREVLGTRGGTK